ncbi:carboxymuconolactone decarboxylase family protein [Methylocystis sp. JR02]|uniref:carboxymuconolactone decarboxylase family protein n=1 Tax=Methylocystis sp. JR02 TaxID=3046284 RepID=UPI0024BAD0B3|nr:carboxymuconolactone decarboxylase family protein [Methylocystis sp. JR02]MDJ0449704.1 carboxymuconolactone decarboxylase family protein [Methylocystis sp. JR02]
MTNDWPELAKALSTDLRNLRVGAPDVMKTFSAMATTAGAPGALDAKTKELIAVAVSVAVRCDDCISFHTKAAAQRGATREEILETLGMAIYMGAGPSVMYASHALSAFNQFAGGEAGDAQTPQAKTA